MVNYPQIAHSYTGRPELDRLTNRSAELWSPLMALAAFFEEMGGIEGLVHAVQEAAQRDVSLSEGKALSQREEAVLQSLDILTRDGVETAWLKASDLRLQVRQLLGLSEEQMGNAQWVGHILKRLQLTDRRRRKAYAGGQQYLMERLQVVDMLERYDVETVDISRE